MCKNTSVNRSFFRAACGGNWHPICFEAVQGPGGLDFRKKIGAILRIYSIISMC
jgi:hypothetical protein